MAFIFELFLLTLGYLQLIYDMQPYFRKQRETVHLVQTYSSQLMLPEMLGMLI